jgi:hypothetical protein
MIDSLLRPHGQGRDAPSRECRVLTTKTEARAGCSSVFQCPAQSLAHGQCPINVVRTMTVHLLGIETLLIPLDEAGGSQSADGCPLKFCDKCSQDPEKDP